MLGDSGVFNNIDDEFNTKFVPEDDDNDDEVNENSVVVSKQMPPLDGKIRIAEVDYVSDEIKNLITLSKSVLTRLDSTIKIGATARLFEVYSQLSNSIVTQLKELRQMNESVAKLKIEEQKKNKNIFGSGNKITFTSNQLLDIITNAQARSEIKTIVPEFIIDDGDINKMDNR